MKRYAFDLETDGLLSHPWEPKDNPVSRIHCAVVIDADSGEEWLYRPGELPALLSRLDEADMLIGHNISEYDLPVLKLLTGWQPRIDVVSVDTKIAARMAFPDWRVIRLSKARGLPKHMWRLHKLESWGLRLGFEKGHFGKDADWRTYSEEMLEYCARDVRVTVKLFHWLVEKSGYSLDSMVLESECNRILYRMRVNGVRLDVDGAVGLAMEMMAKRDELTEKLREYFPPWYGPNGPVKEAKRGNKKRGLEKGALYQNIKLIELNPGSRFHVSRCLMQKYDWKPSKFNKDGTPKVDRKILRDLPWPEAQLFADWEELQKKITMIAEGPGSWLKCHVDGVLHGRVDVSGAKTGRMTHSSPNNAQVPKVGKPYGRECRSKFSPTRKGWKMLGVDASGLELRMLGHYMAKWDGGGFAHIVVEGDPHTEFMGGTGILIRDDQKTWTYARLYGAGNPKLGIIVWVSWARAHELGLVDTPPPKATQRNLAKLGARSRAGLEDKFPALAKIMGILKKHREKRGWTNLPDGRRVYRESDHSALNMLLQGSGAIVMKLAFVLLDKELQRRGYTPGEDYEFMLNVHDEFQMEWRPECLEDGVPQRLATESITKAGEFFNMRCRLDGEAKVGDTWADTH